jgi:membrane protease YdiL (CAAX protease family)
VAILQDPALIAYIVIYLLALGLAVWRRKTFPLGDALMVSLIVGGAFTALVHFIAPRPAQAPVLPAVSSGELIFTLAYLVLVAALLIRGTPMPAEWKKHFVRKQLATLAFKLVVFVAVPLAVLRLAWKTSWAGLGFSAGNTGGQLLAAGVLILLFGGFNLLVGGGAAPIRKGEYAIGPVLIGMLLVFLWNALEVGLVEEFFFRGFVQGRLISALGTPAGGIAVASLLFGLAHVPGIYLRRGDKNGPLGEKPAMIDSILYAILALSPTGWFTGLLFWRTQSLLAPILVHAAVDAVAHTPEFLAGLGVRKQAGVREGDQDTGG